MKPMGINSTQLLSYRDIKVRNTDLFEDAWGLNTQYHDVTDLLRKVRVVPRKRLTKRLLKKIRQIT